MKKVRFLTPLILSAALITAACSDDSATVTETEQNSLIEQYITYAKSDFYTEWQGDSFTKINLNTTTATVDGGNQAVVLVNDNTVTIKGAGTYVLEGTLEGQIIVDTEDKGNVRLVLNGTTITSETSAAIFVENADKTIVSLEKGTENKLTDATNYVYGDDEDEPAAPLFSKDDLTINGAGKLIINGQFEDGIVGKDRLLITGGDITVNAVDDAIRGRDLVAIREAAITVTSGGDGVKASNDTDENKGNIVIESGTFNITAQGDGMQAERDLIVTGGDYTIVTGDGSPETIEVKQDMPGGMGGGQGNAPAGMGNMDMNFMRELMEQMTAEDFDAEQFIANFDESTLPEGFTMADLQALIERGSQMPSGMDGDRGGQGGMTAPPNQGGESGQQAPPADFDPSQIPGAAQNDETLTDDDPVDEEIDNSVSTKGIKAGQLIHITNGTFTLDTLDDAIHSNGAVTIDGGEMVIATGDDGIHADLDLVINDGKISIEKGNEGFEGKNVTVNGGEHSIIVTDDGINVSGGSATMAGPGHGNTGEVNVDEAEILLKITGGSVYINSNGDGLDSNDVLYIAGGVVTVETNGTGPDSAIDFDNGFVIDGGVVVGTGSPQMANGTASNSKQVTALMTFPETMAAGTTTTIINSDGTEIFTVSPGKDYSSLLVSLPDFEIGETYTLKSGELSIDFTLDSQLIYLNETGVTEASTNSMGGGMKRPNMQQGGQPNTVEQQEETTSNN